MLVRWDRFVGHPSEWPSGRVDHGRRNRSSKDPGRERPRQSLRQDLLDYTPDSARGQRIPPARGAILDGDQAAHRRPHADLRIHLPWLLASVRGDPARLKGPGVPGLRRPQTGEEALRVRRRSGKARGRPGPARGVRVVRRSPRPRGVQLELTPQPGQRRRPREDSARMPVLQPRREAAEETVPNPLSPRPRRGPAATGSPIGFWRLAS